MTLISIGFRFMCSLRMYRLWRLHLLESLSLESKIFNWIKIQILALKPKKKKKACIICTIISIF